MFNSGEGLPVHFMIKCFRPVGRDNDHKALLRRRVDQRCRVIDKFFQVSPLAGV